jgi:hypothetical protein
MSDVGEQRRRREGRRRRRRSFSIPWSGSGAQEAEERRKKKMMWGKKSKLTPAPYLYCGTRVVGVVVVLHYPDRFCGRSLRGGAEWSGGSCNRATGQ